MSKKRNINYNLARDIWNPNFVLSKWNNTEGIDWVTIAELLPYALEDCKETNMVVLWSWKTLLVTITQSLKLFYILFLYCLLFWFEYEIIYAIELYFVWLVCENVASIVPRFFAARKYKTSTNILFGKWYPGSIGRGGGGRGELLEWLSW